ncbi:hypothetical protein BKA70DRAFT_1430558 [Coprinopsis sp. MPI-PUGE-AT-0042]|nr:hypothetical protein BKA70DRAFT_1430558 [Coprinopsis sp. MPI-PUGE-AT-0042]
MVVPKLYDDIVYYILKHIADSCTSGGQTLQTAAAISSQWCRICRSQSTFYSHYSIGRRTDRLERDVKNAIRWFNLPDTLCSSLSLDCALVIDAFKDGDIAHLESLMRKYQDRWKRLKFTVQGNSETPVTFSLLNGHWPNLVDLDVSVILASKASPPTLGRLSLHLFKEADVASILRHMSDPSIAISDLYLCWSASSHPSASILPSPLNLARLFQLDIEVEGFWEAAHALLNALACPNLSSLRVTVDGGAGWDDGMDEHGLDCVSHFIARSNCGRILNSLSLQYGTCSGSEQSLTDIIRQVSCLTKLDLDIPGHSYMALSSLSGVHSLQLRISPYHGFTDDESIGSSEGEDYDEGEGKDYDDTLERDAVTAVGEFMKNNMAVKRVLVVAQMSDSPKDRVLFGCDLLPIVVEHLEGYNPSLLAVALTCKAFLEPALAILWRRIDSMEPILLLLPLAMVQGRYQLVVGNAIPHRLYSYSRRVRSLSIINYNMFSDKFPLELHTELGRLPHAQPLFPHLKELHLRLDNGGDTLIGMFLGPLLWFVRLYGQATCDILTQVAIHSPCVKTLELFDCIADKNLMKPIQKYLCLSKLIIHPIVPTLRHFSFGDLDVSNAHTIKDWKTPCQHLETFRYTYEPNSLNPHPPFLNYVTDLQIYVSSVPLSFDSLLRHVAAHTRVKHLDILGLVEGEKIQLESLQPIFNMPKLGTLSLSGMQLQHSAPFRAAFASLPANQLRTLRLPSDIEPQPTLVDLVALLRSLPHLWFLELGISTLSERILPFDLVHSRLTHLSLCDSRTSHYKTHEYQIFPRYMHHWFPNLQLVTSPTWPEFWRIVDSLRKTLA